MPTDTARLFRALVLRELLAEPELRPEFDVAGAAAQIGAALGVSPVDALALVVDEPLSQRLVALVADEGLAGLVRVRDTSPLLRPATEVAAACRTGEGVYSSCCRSALLLVVQGEQDRAFAALRLAAAMHEAWARHHHIYGLIHGVRGDRQRARYELQVALGAEPLADVRERIEEALVAAGTAAAVA